MAKFNSPNIKTVSVSAPKVPHVSEPRPKLPHSPKAPPPPHPVARPHLYKPAPLKAIPVAPAAKLTPQPKAPKTTAAEWSSTPPNDWQTPSDAWEK